MAQILPFYLVCDESYSIEPRGVVEVGLLRERLCWLLIMPW